MILLQIESSKELINLDYIVKADSSKKIIYLNEEGIGLVPKKLTRDEWHSFITSREVERRIL